MKFTYNQDHSNNQTRHQIVSPNGNVIAYAESSREGKAICVALNIALDAQPENQALQLLVA
jgi:hypothetical protein